MGDAQFRTLLEALPQIAEHVEKFQSEAVQQQVVEGLLTALMGSDLQHDGDVADDEPAPPPDEPDRVESDAPPSPQSNGKDKPKRSTKTQGSGRKTQKSNTIQITKNINFWPDGATSLPAFLQEKAPKNHDDRIATVVFWMTEHGGRQSVSAGDVYAGYQAANAKYPASLENGIDRAKFQGYVDGDKSGLTLTPRGENRIRRELPASTK